MSVGRVGVVGAGTMGRGIAQLAALGWLRDRPLRRRPGRRRGRRGGAASRRSTRAPTAGAGASTRRRPPSARVETATEAEQLRGCELLIEAAPEKLELKREIFAGLAQALGPEPVFASNTSSLRVAEIAAGVPQPERVVGMHFFNPPALMKLVEVVAAERSSEQALAAATEVAERMGRTPIRAKDSPGFVANRLARPFSLESLRMLGDGVADVATHRPRRPPRRRLPDGPVRAARPDRPRRQPRDRPLLLPPRAASRSAGARARSRKSWSPKAASAARAATATTSYGEGHEREPDPELGIDAPTLDPEQLAKIGPAAEAILTRLFAQIANEAAFAREEEIASREDMETAMRLGFNWPLGPLAITELIGPRRAVELLDRLAAEHGEAYRAGAAPASRSRGGCVSAERKPASEATARRNREAAATCRPSAPRTWPTPSAASSPASSRRGSRARAAGSSGTWPPTTSSPRSARRPPTPASGARAGSTASPACSRSRRASTSCAASTSRTCTWSRASEGIVVIDPLISAETAAAALALYREHRGERPITGLVYTHCHIDHFGGAAGIVSPEEIAERGIPVLAPEGFLHHAVSENVYAGTAMGRRAGYMYGAKLQRGPDGQIGSGLGQTTSLGTLTLIPPNLEVTETGQEETVDGVRMVFQLTPGTEAPAEMNFHFPEHRVLCIAENATHTMHNVLTLRGALVRDPQVWAALPRRVDRALRRRQRRPLRRPPLAALGQRADRRVPAQAARPLRLHPRPDPAADQRAA